ncbi:MAG: HAD family phosphatase [Oscillospiraceae bacterium]|nr:HAD family phosphatase [Oscillospiraceae bacterium]
MNFIFDVGDVLVEYKPPVYLRSLFTDETLVNKLYEVIFKSPEWLIMDEGRLSHKEAIEIFCKREPELQSEIRQAMNMETYGKALFPLHETIDLLPKIKEAGHGLYYLSNMHTETRDYLLDKNDFFDLFDGGVFSCDIHHIKPSPEIYRHLLNKYSLNPSTCIFFDDMPENTTAAEKERIKAILFTAAECIKTVLLNQQ